MAEEVLGKPVSQLKRERTTAKMCFTKQANLLTRESSQMIESELRMEFQKLSSCARALFDANDDFKMGLLADLELEGDVEAELEKHQSADIEKAAKDCEEKLEELRQIVQMNLWQRYGNEALNTTIHEAEIVSDLSSSMPVVGVNCEGYELQLIHLEELMNRAVSVLSSWERWIPATEKTDIEKRVKQLQTQYNRLVSRKSEFVTARNVEKDRENAGPTERNPVLQNVPFAPVVRIKPTSLPKFDGVKRDFFRWKKDWESLQRQGEPTGSTEVKKIQLLDSVDARIVKELRLSSYSKAEDVFRVLENRYGNKVTIVMEIIEELEKIPPVKGNQPRKVIDLIQSVEKALLDLTELDNIGAIKNPLTIKSIESKLPELIKRDWLIFMINPVNKVTPENHFDLLLEFLKKQEDVLEKLEQLRITDKAGRQDKFENRFDRRYASTKTTKKDSSGCPVCGAANHRDKLFFCKKFKDLTLAEKNTVVRKIGVCKKCLGHHEDDNECSDTFLCKNKDCRRENAFDHHYFLCPRKGSIAYGGKRANGEKVNVLTTQQEEFLAELSAEMAERCRRAFTNKIATGTCTEKTYGGLLKESELNEMPVILMLMHITANAGQKIGTLVDLASDTNYITHKAARKLKLRSEDITLIVHGVAGMTTKVRTKRYLLRVRVKTDEGKEKAHELLCYGLEEIAKVHKIIKPQQLQRFFPEVALKELARPKEIDLLISHREGRLAPQRIKVVGDLVLWDGPLGKTVGGAHPDLFEDLHLSAYESKTHFARSMRTAAVKYEERNEELDKQLLSEQIHQGQRPKAETNSATAKSLEFLNWWKWDSIGAACEPRCGGCRCGNCQPGGKELTLSEERELEIIKECLTYVEQDNHSKSPHWHAKYPWTEDPASLPNNRSGVQATFLRTEKQLKREPEWQVAYGAQIHDMLQRGAAIKLTADAIKRWNGPVWYVSHLIAPNPHSVTTPVRLVWNSSQKFRGVSMNDILYKGPDVLNPIRAVLLRFRRGAYAALGDIKKMYNSVWLEEKEMHLHRFLWRDHPSEELGEYAITRVNIGDRPAGCIAQLAMQETAKLEKFSHLQEERKVIEEDSYVDDILTSHNSQDKLNDITEAVEKILKEGGFLLKHWTRSGQRWRPNDSETAETPSKNKILKLPNQLKDQDSKALGVGYLLEEDKFYIMTSINFSKRKMKMRVEQNLFEKEVRLKTPNPLTRRELLSQVAGLYDPIGLVTPIKQKGAILVRKAFQEARHGTPQGDTWDKPLSESLRDEAIRLFEDYIRVGNVKFLRSLTPADWKNKPWGITFSDGSDKSYGAVAYFRWESEEGIDVRLVESKAKLTPLDQKGEAVKAELCGAVFAARLRQYIEKYTQMEIEKWFHLVDSQTVLGAIQRESYGYQSFFANRVGEIQRATPVQDWWWIPGELNIADIITRGCTPEDLKEKSAWQNGPSFLKRPVEDWPVKSPAEVASAAREGILKFQRKSFSLALTRSQSKDKQNITIPLMQNTEQKDAPSRKIFDGIRTSKLLEVQRFSSLSKLIRVTAWVRRAVKRWLNVQFKTPNSSKWEAKPLKKQKPILTIEEQNNALLDLFSAAQENITFPDTTLNRLVVFKDKVSGLMVCGGRIQAFNEDGTAVPLLPYNAHLSKLIGLEAHGLNHEGVAGTLLKMRQKAWVVKGRGLAKKIVNGCVTCRKARARRCQQVMGDLPLERSEPAAPFEFTTLDLFGPYMVKDEVKKRVGLKVWGIVFCCMASRAIHADIVSDQSTEGFLLAYQRFTALRGHPKKLWSDSGTNFIGAKSVLEDLYKFLNRQDKVKVENEAAKHSTEWVWKFHPPDSPHRNGAAEAAVRLVKRALQNLKCNGSLSWGEFQTLLYSAANLVNERPIDARTQSREDCVEYISPNSLLLGRTGKCGDQSSFEFERYSYKRLRIIQDEINKFWQKWCQLAGPNLFIRNKWHTKERNVAVGDVVWLADQNALRGQYKLARVVGVKADKNGTVRDAMVRVFPSYPVSIVKPIQAASATPVKPKGQLPVKISPTILHRDVRRLVVLIPIEEQSSTVDYGINV